MLRVPSYFSHYSSHLFFIFTLCLLVQGSPGQASGARLTRSPYLQMSTPTSVVIRWRTDSATNSQVNYGTVLGSLYSEVWDSSLTTEHEVKLTGLSPSMSYYYSVGSSTLTLAGDDSDHVFTTSPVAGDSEPIRILILGDSGEKSANAADVRDAYLEALGSLHLDLWLMLGDNAYTNGTDEEYQQSLFSIHSQTLSKSVLWPVRGNHDDIHPGDNNDYYELFSLPAAGEAGGGVPSGTEAYYSFDYGNIHFIGLDSEGSSINPTGPMLTWLALDLAATSQDWIIAYFHHPPYSKGSHDSDDVTDSGGRMRDMRENALPILEAGGVDLVFAAHSHSYERSMLIDGHYFESSTFDYSMIVDSGDGRLNGSGPYVKSVLGPDSHSGTVYTVLGNSSRAKNEGSLDHPVMASSQGGLGFVLLEVDGNRLHVSYLDEIPQEKDHFTMVKGVRGE
jgi:hypothetical protein